MDRGAKPDQKSLNRTIKILKVFRIEEIKIVTQKNP